MRKILTIIFILTLTSCINNSLEYSSNINITNILNDQKQVIISIFNDHILINIETSDGINNENMTKEELLLERIKEKGLYIENLKDKHVFVGLGICYKSLNIKKLLFSCIGISGDMSYADLKLSPYDALFKDLTPHDVIFIDRNYTLYLYRNMVIYKTIALNPDNIDLNQSVYLKIFLSKTGDRNKEKIFYYERGYINYILKDNIYIKRNESIIITHDPIIRHNDIFYVSIKWFSDNLSCSYFALSGSIKDFNLPKEIGINMDSLIISRPIIGTNRKLFFILDKASYSRKEYITYEYENEHVLVKQIIGKLKYPVIYIDKTAEYYIPLEDICKALKLRFYYRNADNSILLSLFTDNDFAD